MFNSFDYLPIDEALIQSDIQSDPDLGLTYRLQLALVHHAGHCENRLASLSRFASSAVTHTSDYQQALYFFTTSLLCQLLSLPAIYSDGQESAHYIKYKRVVGKDKLLPPQELLRDISYGMNLSWGAMYGTLGYYLFMGAPTHYATPSQLVRQGALSYLSSLGARSLDTGVEPLVYKLINLIQADDSLDADWALYAGVRDLIRYMDYVGEVYPHLLFLEHWLPMLEDWYASAFRLGGGLPFLDTEDRQERRAYETLIRLGRLWVRFGQAPNSLAYKYMHHLAPDTWGEFYSDLVIALKQTEYDMSLPVKAGGLGDKLLVPALQTIKVTTDPDTYRYGADSIIRELPWGYDFFLICIASELANRAHILSNPEAPSNIKRCLGLLHLSSLCLKRCSLNKPRLIGQVIANACGSPYTGTSVTNLEVL